MKTGILVALAALAVVGLVVGVVATQALATPSNAPGGLTGGRGGMMNGGTGGGMMGGGGCGCGSYQTCQHYMYDHNYTWEHNYSYGPGGMMG